MNITYSLLPATSVAHSKENVVFLHPHTKKVDTRLTRAFYHFYTVLTFKHFHHTYIKILNFNCNSFCRARQNSSQNGRFFRLARHLLPIHTISL